MKYFFLTLLIFVSGLLVAVGAEYPVSAIPAQLLKDANVIKRIDETKIIIKSPGKAVYYRKYAYTILNENADRYAFFYTYYDKFRDISSISGTLFDAFGNKVKSVKKKDIQDESGNMGTHLALDARFKIHSFYYKGYPYTVEYEQEVEMDGIFYLQDWIPQSGPQVAVQNCKLVVETPAAYNLRYKQFKYNGEPVIKVDKGNKSYTWEVKDLSAVTGEPFSPEWEDLVTKVITAPSDFEIAGYNGNMNSWGNFGLFMTSLYAGKDALPAEVKRKVHELTDKLSSQKDKINTLYKYLQDNTHYISIQLGIGGWQPLDANYVAAKKYGDCKALSNYMVALLKEAGITAYNVLIKAGENESDILTDFPSNQFNHVIVCVPSKKDTVWLECTSQTKSPGYMGAFTGNRSALLIDGANSRIVKTPLYTKNDNLQTKAISAIINNDGELTATVSTTSYGLQQDDLHGILHGLTNEEKLKRLRTAFSIPSYDVTEFRYTENATGNIPYIKEELKLVSKNYASVTGKRLFVKPNILSDYVKKINADDSRDNDIVYDYAFVDRDTVEMKVPDGYIVEAKPKSVTIDNEFGRYYIDYSYSGGIIKMIRSYERNKGKFSKEKFNDFVSFYDAIYKADNAKIVLVKTGD